jgi:cardiolipin synthase
VSTGELVALVLAAIDIGFRLVALVIVPRNRRPQTSMAWLLAIFFIPFVAFFAFLAFGSHRLSPKRQATQETISAFVESRHHEIPEAVIVAQPELTKSKKAGTISLTAPLVTMNQLLGQMPMTRGNHLELFTDYSTSLSEMVAAIDSAHTTVHAEFYIMSVDRETKEFFDALARAKKRGVEVRVLFDQVATARIPGSRRVGKRLREAGIEYRAMLPFQPWRGVYQRPDLRNHRKILVIDSSVAFTGSQNIIERGYRRRGKKNLAWLDLMARCEGPIVDGIEALFIADWFHETHTLLDVPRALSPSSSGDGWMQLVPSGPAVDGESNLRLFNSLMYSARDHIVIVSPYLVPDDSMRYAITSAALRGVRVDVFVSEAGDQPTVFYAQRSYYDELLRAGVNIWLYPAPTVLHSKFIVVDNQVAVMGTSNLDMRSFSLNLELSLFIVGDKEAAELRNIAESYREQCRLLTQEEWNSRGQTTRFIEGLARLTATVQ